MAGPFQHGSSGYPDPPSPPMGNSNSSAAPSGRGRHAPAAGDSPGSRVNFYSHPSRTSIFSSSGDVDFGSPGGFAGFGDAGSGSMDDPTYTLPRAWRSSGLPSFSRAFDFLMTPGRSETSSPHRDAFFVPSYLEGSAYIQRLREAHETRSRPQREPKRSASDSGDVSITAFNPPPLPPGSHRGMAHTVIERPPPFEEEEGPAPLPSRWNTEDQWGGIQIQPDGVSIKYVGPKSHEREHEASATRADHHMPAQCGIYYYEVQIISAKQDDATIGIGFSTKLATMSRPIGWEPESWGYHGDDGRCFSGQNIGRVFGQIFNTGDVIGCGVNFRSNTAFYTKNGVKIGEAFRDVVKGKLYPAVSLRKPGEYIRTNFGQSPFVFNIDDMLKEERERVRRAVEATDTEKLVEGYKQTDLIQTLVLQYLQHDGYIESARAFAEDMKVQKNALNLDPTAKVDGINVKDDEDAINRQRIRRAVLDGDIDRVFKLMNAYYPQVLSANEQVYFNLRCRKFIEMVRKAALVNMANDTHMSNGHKPPSGSQEMDLDMNGNENSAWTGPAGGDDAEAQAKVQKLEQDMLEYGQQLQSDYAYDARPHVTKTLGEIWSLVAYKNPLKQAEVSHLLDQNGRLVVAEELNSAILRSLGKSSRASLEKLYAQASVLLDDLREDGGDGAFVSIQDVINEIPRPAIT